MRIAFHTEQMAKQLGSDQEIARAFKARAKKIVGRLDLIRHADHLLQLQEVAVLEIKPLTNNFAGQWSMRIFPNLLMIFLLDHNPLPLLENGEVDRTRINCIRIAGFI